MTVPAGFPPPGSGPPESLASRYDDATWAAIEAGGAGVVRQVAGPRGHQDGALRLAWAIMAGAAAGVTDAVGRHREEPEIVEYSPEPPGVTPVVSVHLVWGDPQASHIVVRPWAAGT